MNPKRIGFLGFEDVSASDLTGAADVFAAATLDGGYGNRISCYQVCTIGFSSERLRSESGISFIQTFQRAFETAIWVKAAQLSEESQRNFDDSFF